MTHSISETTLWQSCATRLQYRNTSQWNTSAFFSARYGKGTNVMWLSRTENLLV